MGNQASAVHDCIDKFVDKLIQTILEKILKAWPFRADMENTTLLNCLDHQTFPWMSPAVLRARMVPSFARTLPHVRSAVKFYEGSQQRPPCVFIVTRSSIT